ncbi:Fic/DOC family protein [Thalassobacillus hwangdonensis]|uniref:protein adenylyltransferase n=1 Tax=Thalassobacillus hwangdonensis TaxID=546108 RepID=A0ABW3KW79_9BACI
MNNHTSSYCYPGTDVLINLFDIKDPKDLELMEVAYTARRLLTLQNGPVKGAFDLEHLQAIHRYIFRDIFPFAGEIRTENIGKGTFSFANARFIVPEANRIFKELKEENYLDGLLRTDFAKRAAYYMAEINVLHPFREGNGRAQREFIRCMAGRSGYRLDWNLVDNETKMTASVQSKTKIDELASVIGNCIQNELPDDRFAQTFL